MDTLDWQNGYEAVTTDRLVLADTYIPLSPVPSVDKGRLIIEDNSATNYEIVHFTSKDAGGVFTDARNEDSNSTGIHVKGVRVRMNITAQDMKAMRDDVADVVATYSTATVGSIVSAATITPSTNIYSVTGLGVNAAVAAPSGTPTDGQVLVLRIKDDGTSRTLTWNVIYTNVSGLDSLTATTAGKWHVVCCMYSTAAVKWQIVSITTEA